MPRLQLSGFTLIFSVCFFSLYAQNGPEKVQIMLLGSTHFGQESYYKDAPLADLFHQRRQKELQEVHAQLAAFNPDMILIEREAKEQAGVDSVYDLFKSGKIKLTDVPYGRSEMYQLAYALGKRLGHERIYGVNYYAGTSNRILNAGQHIEYYLDELKAFSQVGRSADQSFRQGATSVKEYLNFLNSPLVLQMAYHVMFITPAKVRNGNLNTTEPSLDSNRISYDYVGADFISHFYNRELRIYSNIVTTQLARKSKRILVVMGQRHAAVLTRIFENDPDYQLIPVADYLK